MKEKKMNVRVAVVYTGVYTIYTIWLSFMEF